MKTAGNDLFMMNDLFLSTARFPREKWSDSASHLIANFESPNINQRIVKRAVNLELYDGKSKTGRKYC